MLKASKLSKEWGERQPPDKAEFLHAIKRGGIPKTIFSLLLFLIHLRFGKATSFLFFHLNTAFLLLFEA